MKKKLLLTAFISMSAYNTQATPPNVQEQHRIHFITANMALKAIKVKSEAGDMACAMAYEDFMQNLRDPEYRITFDASIKVLRSFELLDNNECVHKSTREAFQALQPELFKK